MAGGIEGHLAKDRHAVEDLEGVAGVLAHRRPLRRRQRPRLVEDAVGDAELADVVQQRGAFQAAQAPRREPERRGRGHGIFGHASGVVVRVGRLGVDHAGKRRDDAVERRVVGHGQRRGRRHRTQQLDRVDRAQVLPEFIVARQHAHRPHQRRIEPSPRALLEHAHRLVETALGPEDLGHLRDADDLREQRDSVAPEAGRLAAAVPVLVHGPDGFGRGARQAEVEGNGGAAVAANLEQLLLGLGAERRETSESGQPCQDRLVASHHPQRVTELLAPVAPVGQPHGALHLVVVTARKLMHAGGVARAAGVLEQQRVEQIGAVRVVEAEQFGELHPNQARPPGVAGRVSLGDVERPRQTGNHLHRGHGRRRPARRFLAGESRAHACARARSMPRARGAASRGIARGPPGPCVQYRVTPVQIRHKRRTLDAGRRTPPCSQARPSRSSPPRTGCCRSPGW